MPSGSEINCLDIPLIVTIDEVLNRILGEVGACAVYSSLQIRFGLDKASIPFRMDYFRESLVELLGSGGEVLLSQIDEKRGQIIEASG